MRGALALFLRRPSPNPSTLLRALRLSKGRGVLGRRNLRFLDQNLTAQPEILVGLRPTTLGPLGQRATILSQIVPISILVHFIIEIGTAPRNDPKL